MWCIEHRLRRTYLEAHGPSSADPENQYPDLPWPDYAEMLNNSIVMIESLVNNPQSCQLFAAVAQPQESVLAGPYRVLQRTLQKPIPWG
jgi:hypothetical protein